jgi:hypothetical protein
VSRARAENNAIDLHSENIFSAPVTSNKADVVYACGKKEFAREKE